MPKPILLYTSIWENTAKDITEQILEYPDGEPLDIWMNTPGGSITAGWSIIAALNEKNIDVNYTVVGDASSFGFIMLLFGKNNKSYDTSNFLIHRAASWFEDYMTEDELKDVEQRNKVIRKKLESRIDENIFIEVTGKTFDDIFSMETRLDVRLTAQQAKKIGLIDSIVKLDSKKREEIESRYLNEIAALYINDNSNENKKKMGNLFSMVFGEKDSLEIAAIDGVQFGYKKLEIGARILPVGKGEHEPISGTFEAEDKKITVVDNEITAVVEFDKKQKEIDALKSELKAVKDGQITAEEIAEVFIENNKKYEARIKALESALESAKLMTSTPKLPEGEFQEDKPQIPNDEKSKQRAIQKAIDAKQSEVIEAVKKTQTDRRL